jgi:hypothetical protein
MFKRKVFLAVAFMAVVGIFGALGFQGSSAQTPAESDTQIVAFDVAENMSRFTFDPSLADDDGLPKYGAAFITQGYIYPSGTLNEGNGVLADGSPEFPDKVIGQWTCRGWYVAEGALTKSGPMVMTTQVYSVGEGLGDATFVTEGYELADVGVAIERAITGGTGPYQEARGQIEQTFLGFNASEGVNLHVVADIRDVAAGAPGFLSAAASNVAPEI